MPNQDDSEPALRQTNSDCRARLGPTHPETLSALGSLGKLLFRLERYVEAEPLQRELLAAQRKVLGASSYLLTTYYLGPRPIQLLTTHYLLLLTT